MANAALSYIHDELSVHSGGGKAYIDFGTQAAYDYFSDRESNSPYQQQIFNTFFRATLAYRGIGWSDWWNDRYVSISCTDLQRSCATGTGAYTYNAKADQYPTIVYCNLFFQLNPLAEQIAAVKLDVLGLKKQNTKNLFSQATVSLHEWLHLKGSSAEICEGGYGCSDTRQQIGFANPAREWLTTYTAGPAKLLAQRSIEKAVITNDNYVYFAQARYMQELFGTYPKYPTAWDVNLNRAQNIQRQSSEPGDFGVQSWELQDQNDISSDNTASVTSNPVSASSPPNPESTLTPLSYAQPNFDNVVCEATSGSPIIDDCVHAFEGLNDSPQQAALHGKKGGTWWAGYVQTCALAIYYTGDWSNACKGNLGDVAAHASAIFEQCADGGLGTVGGHVDFSVGNCPAQIEIIRTSGEPPLGGL